ncbi:hypothetical protein [Paenibacillus woosongensis]|nr:hypothetical protein [Paenibacillus woosongensis]
MLETERYREAAELLQFLLQCQGQDPRHYEEWQALLDWLNSAFPSFDQGEMPEEDDYAEEDMARQHAEAKLAEDHLYVEKLLHAVTEKPLSEQTFLALEQLVYLDRPEVDEVLISWIEGTDLHPLLQFRVFQTLQRRGTQGTLSLKRGGEMVEIDIEAVPLKPEQFPAPIQAVLERVGNETQVHDPTLFYFAQELWSQFIMAIYGTKNYYSILSEEDAIIDIWAAALHLMVSDSLPGGKSDEELRTLYGITDDLRLKFEQACRTMRQFVAAGVGG